MIIMLAVGALFLLGVGLTARWTPRAAEPLDRPALTVVPPVADVARWYARGTAVVLVSGFWTGILVTGPAIRLIMRLLAVTASDSVQGRLTEAEEVVGRVSLGGTIGLILFGGVLSGLLSGTLWALVGRFLPRGPWGGLAFGALHLVVAATRIDPLRADNPDFGLVGPGWLSVLLYSAACLLHGLAIAAFASRYRRLLNEGSPGWARRRRIAAPLVLPGMMTLALIVPVGVLLVGAGLVVAVSRSTVVLRAVTGRGAIRVGQVAIAALALAFLPGAVTDLADIVGRATL